MMVDGCFYSTRKGGLVRKRDEIAFESVEGARRRPGIFDLYCFLEPGGRRMGTRVGAEWEWFFEV